MSKRRLQPYLTLLRDLPAARELLLHGLQHEAVVPGGDLCLDLEPARWRCGEQAHVANARGAPARGWARGWGWG